ncbi:UDP-N-acetylmuramoyl-tripeptide--D-alanyl-D-alanine ligase [Siminovitchia sp. FSL H7-0308]|uniref:UDP-N-acetylmuramoyl-tripeptide--D-alanyl-D-alanine ligase n=1 Tax=Siminovitchia thermophila TaxID=1245522 RepID=A0ABS2RB45_9BACI|nr:UDP-N-acetylmuramoyl-tripeptide--D-alanyl-D-alanine ligase [Siminovitchia thermophila]MBM7715816.1 UDP-N-acetylmuramoyl-tripeptide--D-alanyl-D-alanine ligase [Siminovitchia thermophila]
MIERTIGQISTMINVMNDLSPYAHVMLKGASIDSRKIIPGNLFVPLKGDNSDGHQFVEKAFEQGAAASLWQEDVPHPPEGYPLIVVKDVLKALQDLAKAYRNELPAKVVGITGSNGKTTTKDIAASVMGETYRVQKTAGNLNNHIGLPLTILSLREDTEIAILEMGMSGRGEISLLTDIAKPDVAIITNIGEAHLLDLGSREAIADAKFEITEGLKEDSLFVYPGNEPLLVQRASRLKQTRLKTFGETPDNDLYPLHIQMEERGSTFVVSSYPDEPLFLPIAGKHNMMNAMAALHAAREFSVPFSDIKEGLKSVKLSTMRMEWRKGPKGSTILNDVYNSSPTALRAVIGLIESMDEKRRKILVLGDMLELGEDEEKFHREIGEEISPEKITYVYTYGRLGKSIAKGAEENFPEERVFSFQDQDELAAALQEKLTGGEIIAVKASRGMKMEKVVEALTLEVDE